MKLTLFFSICFLIFIGCSQSDKIKLICTFKKKKTYQIEYGHDILINESIDFSIKKNRELNQFFLMDYSKKYLFYVHNAYRKHNFKKTVEENRNKWNKLNINNQTFAFFQISYNSGTICLIHLVKNGKIIESYSFIYKTYENELDPIYYRYYYYNNSVPIKEIMYRLVNIYLVKKDYIDIYERTQWDDKENKWNKEICKKYKNDIFIPMQY